MEHDDDLFGVRHLFSSCFYLFVIVIISSVTFSTYIIEPFMRDGSIHDRPRFTINQLALDTIAEDDSMSVIAFGSSMMFKGLDGGCVSDNLQTEALVYNLGQISSRHYTDMMHIPRTILSNPELVLIEVSPHTLNNPTFEKELDYVELRFKLDSMYQSSIDSGDWSDLIQPGHESWIATNDLERMYFRQEYIPKAIEERMLNILMNDTFRHPEWTTSGQFDWLPPVDSMEWEDYLQSPYFTDDKWGFDGMTTEKRIEYNNSKMRDSSKYYPLNNSLSTKALHYQITSLLNNEIKVMIVNPPQHPLSLNYVPEGQWDSVNETIQNYSKTAGVYVFDQLWEVDWGDEHFWDRNHLDDEGRLEFCNRISPLIDLALAD